MTFKKLKNNLLYGLASLISYKPNSTSEKEYTSKTVPVEIEKFHFIVYMHTPFLSAESMIQSFATNKNPENMGVALQMSLGYGGITQRVGLAEITEDVYIKLKKNAHTQYERTRRSKNTGFVDNFNKNYKKILSIRDMTLE